MEKIDVIEHYGDLEHVIDLKCELILFNCEPQSPVYNFVNASRDKLIKAIQEVCKLAISSDQSIFGFLLIPHHGRLLPKFVIAPKTISKSVQTSLK